MRLGCLIPSQSRSRLLSKAVLPSWTKIRRRYTQSMTVLDWLLNSDPAIRWQVLRDLAHAPDEVVAAERARVATEGWGAKLLALQGEDGQWAGGACFPAQS